jgi:hypothetical protein
MAESKKLPEGVKHLHGALYLIPFDAIQLPKGEDDGGKWSPTHNPRGLTKKGRDSINDPERASRMRNSIRDKTLLAPMICRWVDGSDTLVPQLVGGRCRYDALSFLIKKKEVVKDPSTASFDEETGEFKHECKPANEVYGSDGEGIVCQVFAVPTDLEALGLAYTENACREQLTEGHDIAVVIEMREFGATDEEILKILDYQDKWLRDTTKMIEALDERTLTAVIEGEVIREGAMGLAKIDDLEIRHKVLDTAVQDAHEDHQKRMERLRKKFASARDSLEIAEGEMVEAKFDGDEAAIESASKKLEEAEATVERTKKQAETASPVVKNKNVRAGVQAVTGDDESGKRCLREPKIRKFYHDALKAIIDAGGVVDDDLTVDTDAAQMALTLIQGILTGEREIATLLQDYAVEYEEEYEEDDDEDDSTVVAIRSKADVEEDLDEDDEDDEDLEDLDLEEDLEAEDRIYPPGEDEYDDYD